MTNPAISSRTIIAQDYQSSGHTLYTWIDEATRDATKSILFIVGAGVSMTGVAAAPSGGMIGQTLENFIWGKGINLPSHITGTGDVAKLYEYYCYSMDRGEPRFDRERHHKFADQVASALGGFFLSGPPNDEHRALEREVNSNENIRIYSLNVDNFFEEAISMRVTLTPAQHKTVNAAVLAGNAHSPDYRNWKILYAHGAQHTRSVWSDRILTTPFEDNDDAWGEERRIIQASLQCISNGPEYSRVVFAGVNAPLIYLLEPLIARLRPELNWMWINPGNPPQEWLIQHPEFTSENGIWAKSSISDVLIQSIFSRYENWVRVSCRQPVDLVRWGKGFDPVQKKQYVVKAVHRARRLFMEGSSVADSLGRVYRNIQKMEQYHKCTDPYDPPVLTEQYLYVDSKLAATLHLLETNNIRITPEPGDDYPKMTVARGNTNDVSVQILRLSDPSIAIEVAKGLAFTIQESFTSELDRHYMIIFDAIDPIVQIVAQELSNVLSHSFANFVSRPKVTVITLEELTDNMSVLNQSIGRTKKP